MCLYMPSPQRVILPGGLCVKNQVFLAIQKLNSTTNKDGFVGLGPEKSGDDQSYIASLKNQEQIKEMKVGLNYENNMDG